MIQYQDYSGRSGGEQLIKEYSNEIGVSSEVKDDALAYYEKIDGKVSYRSYPVRASACLYLACRHNQVPVTPDDFPNHLFRIIKRIKQEIDIPELEFVFTGEFVSEYVEQLELDDSVKQLALEIGKVYFNSPEGSGRSKRSVSAGAVYLASKRVTLEDIASVSGLDKGTVRDSYQDQRDVYEKEQDRQLIEF